MKKTCMAVSLLLSALLLLSSCGDNTEPPAGEDTTPTPETTTEVICSEEMLQDYSNWADEEYYTLQLNGDSVISMPPPSKRPLPASR